MPTSTNAPADIGFDPEDDPVAAQMADDAPKDGDDGLVPRTNPGPPKDHDPSTEAKPNIAISDVSIPPLPFPGSAETKTDV